MQKKPSKSAEIAPPAEAEAPREDVLIVGGPSEGGEGFRVLRKRDDTIQIGELRSMKEGQPIHGEVVKLRPREESERVFDVEVLVPAPENTGARHGPAQVATSTYRENWDAIFGAPKTLN